MPRFAVLHVGGRPSQTHYHIRGTLILRSSIGSLPLFQIRRHPWFRKNLPTYLQQKPPEISSRGIDNIDPAVLASLMAKLDLKDKQKTIEELQQDRGESDKPRCGVEKTAREASEGKEWGIGWKK